MIKRIFILLLLVLISCTDQLLEKTSPLDGIYYILDGWEKFESEDYDRAHDLFSTVLLNNNTQYFGEAYLALAWNSIYKANTIQGVTNSNDRQYQRNISDEYFTLAEEYINSSGECLIEESCSLSILCQDLLVGQAYNSSYLALESSRVFYDYGLDPLAWEEMNIFSERTISYSDTLLNQCNNFYIFEHDSTINHNSIRVLRAQTYVRIGEFDKAEVELNNLDENYLPECDLENQTVIECLNDIE